MASKVSKCLRKNFFVLSLILATVVGYIVGTCLQSYNLSTHTVYLIGYPGQLVLRAFFMIIVPLLFCSLVLGIASLRKGGDARMVAITIVFFLGLSSFAAIMGAVAGHVVHPGQKITGTTDISQSNMSGRKGVILDSMLDLLRNAIPENIIQATFMKEYTHVEALNLSETDPSGNFSGFTVVYQKTIQQKQGVNFMGLLVFSILFGAALASLGDKGEHLYQVINQMNSVIMKILKYFLNFLPVGMFFWMLREGLETTAPLQLLGYLGVFLATAFGCIAFHQIILLPGLYLIIVRKNPLKFHINMFPAILTAFGTASSFTALLLFISAPGTVSGGSPVYLLTIMAAAGVEKPQFISLILPMEWLMERFRTVMNVVADSYVAAFVEKLSAGKLPPEDNSTDLEMNQDGNRGPICAYDSSISDSYRKGFGHSINIA